MIAVSNKFMINKKSKGTTWILALFLGAFGAHKFYLGKTAQGILYLLFFWTFIPGMIAFIEFIMYVAMSDEQFDEKYNQLWLRQQELNDAMDDHLSASQKRRIASIKNEGRTINKKTK